VSPLEGFGQREWVCFERALVVRDMFLGGERTFLSQEDARAFRSMIYAQYGETATITPDLTRFFQYSPSYLKEVAGIAGSHDAKDA
jgi:hypothetical protein